MYKVPVYKTKLVLLILDNYWLSIPIMQIEPPLLPPLLLLAVLFSCLDT